MGVIVFVFMIFVGISGIFRGNTELGCMVPMGIIFLIIAIVYGLFDTKPRVILDSQGISARDWGGIKILWADIRDVYIVSIPLAGNSIAVELYDKEKYIKRISQNEYFARKMNKWFTNAEFSFLSNSLNGSTNQIYQEVQARISSRNHF